MSSLGRSRKSVDIYIVSGDQFMLSHLYTVAGVGTFFGYRDVLHLYDSLAFIYTDK